MSDGHMLVTFGSVADGATDTENIAKQIDQQLDDLKAYLAPMVASWTGQAASDYNALQLKWDNAADALNGILHQIAQALTTANSNYTSAETTNSSIWA